MSRRKRTAIALTGLLAGVAMMGSSIGRCLGAEASAERWRVKAPSSVAEHEIRFGNAGASFVGTLVTPNGASKHPVIVVTHGAEAPTRDFGLYRQRM